MSIRVVSVDLWGTIFDYRSEMDSSLRRRALVRNYAAKRGVTDSNRVDQAYITASRHFYDTYETKAVTLTPRERLSHQLGLLGIDAKGDEFDQLVEDAQNALLGNPPPLAPNIHNGLATLASDYKLVVVSDTGMSPGRVVRKIFENYGIARHFADYSFSDENGKSKPHPVAFESVLNRVGCSPSEFIHIGDTEWSDIKGAKSIGGLACLYVGLNDKYLDETEADFVLRDWANVTELTAKIREK